MEYDLKGKEILVTGASGFIGSHVAKQLSRIGAHVRAMVRNPAKAPGLAGAGLSVVMGDLNDQESLGKAVQGCQVVFNFAGATNDFKPREYFERVNISGTRLLADAVLKANVERLIHVSTVWVYGLWGGPGTCETSACLESGQAYSDTKLEAERVVLRLIAERGLPAIILQPSEVYGPGDPHWTERPLAL